MKYRLILISLFISVFFSQAFSSNYQNQFEIANKFYSNESYDSAAFYYNQIINSGMSNSSVYYNLGNTYFRLKKNGMARLYYEKALKLSPQDKDIEANIKFINASIVDRVPEPERDFIELMLWKFHILLSLKIQLWLLYAFVFTIALLLSIALYTNRNRRLWLTYISVLLTLVTILLGLSAGIKIYDQEMKKYGIVLIQSSDAKNQPDGSKILFTAHEGTRFLIRKTESNWSLVSLPNGVSGWIKNTDFGKI